MQDPNTKEAGSFVGDRLVSVYGDEIGEIHELLIDAELGVVDSAVVSFHGLAGFEGKLFVIPWRALRVAPEEHRFIFDLGEVEDVAAKAAQWKSLFQGDELEWATNGRECFGFRKARN